MKGVVCSAMHTGTWFVIELLKTFGQGSVVPWRHAFEVGGGLRVDWMHVHVGCDPELVPWEEHRYIRNVLVDAFVESGRYPVLVPIRDPLAVLVTQENRRGAPHVPDGERHLWCVEALAQLGRWHAEGRPYIHWLPVDLLHTPAGRMQQLRDLCAFLGYEPDEDLLERTAVGWYRQNQTLGDSSGLRRAYRRGDTETVLAAFPVELERMAERPEVFGMYEALGYELPWACEVT